MSQNIEIEFKNILSKEEYCMLIDYFRIPETQFFSQENHYFDTPDFLLKEKGSALRIRKKGNNYEMTLKQPADCGLLETNQLLSFEEATLAIRDGILPDGIIKEHILKLNIPYEKIEYFGCLLTKRAEMNYKAGLLVFDHSYYLNIEDFELEYEVDDYQYGQEAFKQLLFNHGIPQRDTMNKIQRFYLEKYRNNKK